MSATMEKHVRIRVFFENSSQAPTWLLVDHESMYTIQDLENEIRQRYFGHTTPFVLSLEGCVLPKSERTVILRDNDRVVVSESNHKESTPDPSVSFVKEQETAVSPDFNNAEETELIASTQDNNKKRKKKEMAISPDLNNTEDKEEIQHTASTQDKIKKRKKKRKLDKSEETLESIASCSTEKVHSLKKTRKKKHNQIEETQESQPPVDACFTEENQSLDNGNIESPVLHVDKKKKTETKRGKRSRESISTEITNTVPQSGSAETEVSVTNTVPPVNKKRQYSLIGEGIGKDKVLNNENKQEGDHSEEEKGVKKRRRRRRKRFSEAEASEPKNQKKKSVDNKLQKRFQPKSSRNAIDIYSNKNNHKVFSESESEEDTATAQESGTRMADTKTVREEQMESLQRAKEKLLEKVEQEYKSLTDDSDVSDRHLLTNQHLRKSVQEPSTNQPPNKTLQELPTERPLHENVQQPLIGDVQVSTGMSRVQLQLSALANGVPVYTRQRQKRYFNASHGKELSKEQQLSTSLTNKSIIITNDQPTAIQKPDKEDTKFPPLQSSQRQEDKEVVCVDKPGLSPTPPVQDYTKFPPLQGTPRQGDKIAYKILELSDSYTPEVSNYKEGVVLNFYHDSQLVEIETGESDCGPQGKFHLNYDDDSLHIEPKQSLPWESLMETRLLDIV